jgi:hypothetical protein
MILETDEVALEGKVETEDDFVDAVGEIKKPPEYLTPVAVFEAEVDPVAVEKDEVIPGDEVGTEDIAFFGADIEPTIVENNEIVLEDEVETEGVPVLRAEVDPMTVENDEVVLEKEPSFGGPKAISTIVTTSVISTTVYVQLIVKAVSSMTIV